MASFFWPPNTYDGSTAYEIATGGVRSDFPLTMSTDGFLVPASSTQSQVADVTVSDDSLYAFEPADFVVPISIFETVDTNVYAELEEDVVVGFNDASEFETVLDLASAYARGIVYDSQFDITVTVDSTYSFRLAGRERGGAGLYKTPLRRQGQAYTHIYATPLNKDKAAELIDDSSYNFVAAKPKHDFSFARELLDLLKLRPKPPAPVVQPVVYTCEEPILLGVTGDSIDSFKSNRQVYEEEAFLFMFDDEEQPIISVTYS